MHVIIVLLLGYLLRKDGLKIGRIWLKKKDHT